MIVLIKLFEVLHLEEIASEEHGDSAIRNHFIQYEI